MKLALFLAPFVLGDMIYQNRIGNNRIIANQMRSPEQHQKSSYELNVIAQVAQSDAFQNRLVRDALRRLINSYSLGNNSITDSANATQGKQRFRHFRNRFRNRQIVEG